MDPHADDVVSRPAPPPDDTRRYAAEPAQVYDVRFPPSRPLQTEAGAAGSEHSTEWTKSGGSGAHAPAPSSAHFLPPGPAPSSAHFLPRGPAPSGAHFLPRGTVLVVHGGFWRQAYDRSHAGPQAVALAGAGWHVAVGEYRRVGMNGGGWPGTFEDVAALVAAVAQDPDLPRPLYLMGHSAGGHLVAWAANQPWATTLAGVVVLAGCVDLSATDRLHLGSDAARDFLGDPAAAPESWHAADPMRSLPPRCRVRLVHGELDGIVPVEVTEAYVQESRRLGADVSLEVVPDAGHFSLIDPEHPAWRHTVDALR